MNIEKFIAGFKSQLENENFDLSPHTDYVNSEFWDSLTNMVVIVLLEDEFNVKLNSEELNSFTSIQALYDFVKSKQK